MPTLFWKCLTYCQEDKKCCVQLLGFTSVPVPLTLILFILKVSHETLGKANKYSGAKSAPFSHSTVLYFTENLLKKFKYLKG